MSLLKKIFSSKTNASSISKPDLGGSPEAEVEQLGLFLLKDNTAAANNLDIVAVHGLGGHYLKTWAGDNGKLWLRDSVPSKLENSGLNSRVFSYGYDSSTAFSKAVTDITDEAAMLLDRIKGERKSQLERHRPIIFIAHSLGGILVKKAMIIAHERSSEYGELLRSIRAAMFLGTPHRGSDAAYWAAYAARVLKVIQLGRATNDSFVSTLQRNSSEFANISQQWIERAAPLRIRTFYETERLLGELIVDRDSARLGMVNEIAIGVAGANHRSISKFRDFNSQNYKLVWNATEELAQYALGVSSTSIPQRLNGEYYTKKIFLPSGVKLAESNPPVSVDPPYDNPAIEESLEWLTKSPEYEMWKNNEDGASLWLYGPPGDGKTFATAYILKSLGTHCLYTKKRDVVSIFCSSDDSKVGLVTSLAFQLIQKNEDRARIAQERMPITNSQKDKQTDQEFEQNMWKLLETVIMVGPNHEAVIIIDGIDRLSVSTRSSFLDNFCALQANIQRSAIIRVLMSSRPYVDIKKALDHYLSIERDKERKECLATLFFQEWNARETRVETVIDGGSWLSCNDAYQNWKTDPDHNLLWIEGKPGSGKSTLAKHIVRKIRDERTSSLTSGNSQADTHGDRNPAALENEVTIVAEFYYSFRGGCKETSHGLMLQSIVYQIWKQNYRLFPLIQDQYRKLRRRAKMLWGYNDLKSALDSLHSVDFDLKIVIVVDAMDESDSYNRIDVLKFLHLLSSRKSRCNIRLLVASRPEIKPNPRIGKFAHIILQKENNADILIVVNNWIRGLELGDRHLSSRIGDYIVEHSDGVFLWVTLVLRDLEEYINRGAYREAGLWDRLRGLPRDLGGREGFYRAMINSLISYNSQALDQQQRKEDGQRILAWTTFPKRPLFLSELTDALAAPAQSKRMNPSSDDLANNRPRDLDRGILSLCGGLVESRETDSGQIVQLIHQTVREFLLDQKPPPPAEPYDLNETQGDFEIADTCCRYLRIVFEAKIPLKEADSEFSHVEELTEHLSNHPLLKYSITYFKDHLHYPDPKERFTKIRGEFESFITGVGKKKSYSSLILSRWIRSLNWANLHLDTDETSATDCLNFVLTWAAGAGKDQALEALLALGADIDSRALLQHDSHISYGPEGITPLMNAARSNRTSTVKLLLSKGADVNTGGGYHGNNALQAASQEGHDNIVELLLSRGADVNAQGGLYGNALQAASMQGHDKIVELLLSKGADISAGGEHYGGIA